MKFTNGLKRIAATVHLLHDRAYSWWKWREIRRPGMGSLSHPEREFYLKLRPALEGDDLVVYDIGASVGVFSGMLAKLPNVTIIHAFEPIPGSFGILTERLRRYGHVKCHNVALGDTAGIVNMYVSRSADSSSLIPPAELLQSEFPGVQTSHEIPIKIVRLDDYVSELRLPQPDVVKIDVQGFEDKVLRGGERTIGRARYCILEMSLDRLYENSPLFDDIYREIERGAIG